MYVFLPFLNVFTANKIKIVIHTGMKSSNISNMENGTIDVDIAKIARTGWVIKLTKSANFEKNEQNK